MSDWQKLVDEGSGQQYYYNTTTGEASWDMPPNYVDPDAASQQIADTATFDGDWVTMIDESSGVPYYYNNTTGETSWTNPNEVFTLDTTAAQAELQIERDKWTQQLDEASGTYYYINKATGESQWEVPACFNNIESGSSGNDTRDRVNSTSNESQNSNSSGKMNNSNSINGINGNNQIGSSLNSPLRKMSINSVRSNSTINSSQAGGGALQLQHDQVSALSDNQSDRDGGSSSGGGARRAFDFGTLDDPLDKKSSVDGGSTSNRIATGDADDSDEEAQSGYLDYADFTDPDAFKRIDCDLSLTDIDTILGDISLESYVKSKTYREKSKKNPNYFINVTSFNWQPDSIKVPLIYYIGHDPFSDGTDSYILDVDYSQQSVKCFKRVLGFMGDRVTSSSPLSHAEGLLKLVVNSSQVGIRDEVYCQICKQLNANPSAESVNKAWELLILCLASFPPSPELGPLILKYLVNKYSHFNSDVAIKVAEDVKLPSINQLMATSTSTNATICLCMKYLLQTLKFSLCRQDFFSSIELESLWAGRESTMRVFFLDGSSVMINFNSWTTVEDIENHVHKKIGILELNRIAFGLFECSTTNSSFITTEDVWTKLKSSSRIGEVIFRWFSSVTPDSKVARVDANRPHSYRLFYKVQHYVNVMPHDEDQQSYHLFVSQAMYDVSKLKYPIQEKDAYFLAAVQFIANYKDLLISTSRGRRESVQKVDIFKDKAYLGVKSGSELSLIGEKYISPKFLECQKSHGSELIEKEIMAIYESLCMMPPQEARRMYFDYVTSFKLYGTVLFLVEAQLHKDDSHFAAEKKNDNAKGANSSSLFDNSSDSSSSASSSSASQIRLYYLAVANWALILIDIETGNVCREFRYESILTWAYKFHSLLLVTGSKSRPIKQYFKTGQSDLGKEIYDLIKIHVDYNAAKELSKKHEK